VWVTLRMRTDRIRQTYSMLRGDLSAQSGIRIVNAEPFLKPRLTGPRFEGGVVPLHVLADFAVLEQMIVDIAKWKFRSDNPNRKRVPRGFTDGISLKLTGVKDGSAIPVISLFFAATTLFPPEAKSYFEDARAAIVGSIREADQGLPITKLPSRMLGYFARFGRSLEPGEAVEFEDADSGPPARLTQETRHRLVIASTVKEYTGDVVLHGTITGMEAKDEWFNLARPDGTTFKAQLSDTFYDTILEAFNSYAKGEKLRVRVYAIGRFDREQRLKGIESVDQVVVIDPLDIRARVEELKLLQHGWLDGKGLAPPPATLDWITAAFEERYPDDLRLPYLFPTPAGRLLAEWSPAPWSLSLEIDSVAKRGYWHALNLDTDGEAEKELDLASADEWTWLAEQIRSKGGVAE